MSGQSRMKQNYRKQVFANVVIFQIKLAMDALRDLLLSPVSISCALFDIVQNNPPERSYYQKLMKLGYHSDRWLNLFAFRHKDSEQKSEGDTFAIDNDHVYASTTNQEQNVDKLFDKIKQVLEQQLANGTNTATARLLVEKHLAKLNYITKQQSANITKNPSSRDAIADNKENGDNT